MAVHRGVAVVVLMTTIYFLMDTSILMCELKSVSSGPKDGGGEEGESGFVEYYDYEVNETGCEDDLPKENCSKALCGDRQDMRAMLCMKSCGYCQSESSEEPVEEEDGGDVNREASAEIDGEEYPASSTLSWSSEMGVEDFEDGRKGCEDKLPTCSAHYSQEFCCQLKQAMNYSCEKTCKFCSQTPATLVPPGTGGGVLPPGQVPTATSNQDPCRNNEGQPPSVTVDGPNYGGLTTTTTTTTTTAGPLDPVLPTTPQGHPITKPPVGR